MGAPLIRRIRVRANSLARPVINCNYYYPRPPAKRCLVQSRMHSLSLSLPVVNFQKKNRQVTHTHIVSFHLCVGLDGRSCAIGPESLARILQPLVTRIQIPVPFSSTLFSREITQNDAWLAGEITFLTELCHRSEAKTKRKTRPDKIYQGGRAF